MAIPIQQLYKHQNIQQNNTHIFINKIYVNTYMALFQNTSKHLISYIQ